MQADRPLPWKIPRANRLVTPDPGSYVNDGPTPNPVTVRTGYNYTWVMFRPNDGLCSAGWRRSGPPAQDSTR
ncbi:hypothetical protein CA983_37025 [Streptomyces swartbergensis]|uniref:Uncharacterized protein n=1 Tax=Streptomyces swartbergensis TaxID=487165 RepID=A0A243REJ2_9ACTN|nr:hypothetical protein CA983_37025 [Streptomyces swartbergensis]